MIDILLAAYNGEDYLEQQIESIVTQTVGDWRLTVQDDGSVDSTVKIVQSYAAAFPGKILLKERTGNSGGAKYNFYDMLLKSDADYIMTCDHDDVWLPDKLSKTMKRMVELEGLYGIERPLLVHTDLKVVDADLNVLAESMWHQQGLDPSAKRLENYLVQNNVTGCTVMANRALLKMLPQILPPNMIMHDWWMALVAAAFGEIGAVKEPTILYRQHASNEVGAKNTRKLGYNAKRAMKFSDARRVLMDTYLQTMDFYNVYRKALSPAQREVVKAYADMGEYSKWKKLRTLRKYHLWKQGFARRVGQVLFC